MVNISLIGPLALNFGDDLAIISLLSCAPLHNFQFFMTVQRTM